eukprot:Nk52_evm12s152 gene=Nk52_evmTU12s152
MSEWRLENSSQSSSCSHWCLKLPASIGPVIKQNLSRNKKNKNKKGGRNDSAEVDPNKGKKADCKLRSSGMGEEVFVNPLLRVKQIRNLAELRDLMKSNSEADEQKKEKENEKESEGKVSGDCYSNDCSLLVPICLDSKLDWGQRGALFELAVKGGEGDKCCVVRDFLRCLRGMSQAAKEEVKEIMAEKRRKRKGKRREEEEEMERVGLYSQMGILEEDIGNDESVFDDFLKNKGEVMSCGDNSRILSALKSLKCLVFVENGLVPSKKANLKSPFETLKEKLRGVIDKQSLLVEADDKPRETFGGLLCKHRVEILGEFPQKWDAVGDLVLLPENAFPTLMGLLEKAKAGCQEGGEEIKECCRVEEEWWRAVAESLNVKRVALKARIANNDKRTSQVRILYPSISSSSSLVTKQELVLSRSNGTGENEKGVHEFQYEYDPRCWVKQKQNGIWYHYDVTKCMFSAGNVTERKRVASLPQRGGGGEVLVDLFTGIGYFAVPYLVYGECKFAYLCEWNEHAVIALHKNLLSNGVTGDRFTILYGDNRIHCPVGVADRVNLGLIPDSSCSWKTACKALKPQTGGWLHVHGNCTVPGTVSATSGTSSIADGSGVTASSIAEGTRRCFWEWGEQASKEMRLILAGIHGGNEWSVKLNHVECVKSYAPRVYHIVADIECRPSPFSS